MTMSPLSKAETSQTSIVPMALPMPHLLKLGGLPRPVVQAVLQVSAAGGIAAGAAARAAVVAGAAEDHSNGTICRAE
jgi:hypothetical protein